MNIKDSKIIYGGASLSSLGKGYGFGEISEKAIHEILEFCLEAGIKSFDTAPIYGHGHSELMLGRFIKRDRSDFNIITKGGVSWHANGRVNMTNEPKVIESMLHQSLKTLDTDYVDIYLIHYPDPRVDIRKSLEVIEKARYQGKVERIGLSNTNISEIKLAQEVCPISVIQNQCNLFDNDIIDLGEFCSKHGIETMGHSPLYKGVLSGNVHLDRKYSDSDFRSWAPWWKKSDWKERVERVDKFCKKFPKVKLLELALLYSLKSCDSLICGATSREQLKEIVDSVNSEIDDLDELFKEF